MLKKSLSTNAKSTLIFNLANVTAQSNMLGLDNNALQTAKIAIALNKNQTLGTYRLASGLNEKKGSVATFTIGGTTYSGKVGTTLKKNGMAFTVASTNNETTLTLGLVAGKMQKGSTANDKLTGTVNSDIFYGGTGNDTINGKNGRDVAIYDTEAWGKDIITKTSGTMTLLFVGIKKSNVTSKMSGSDLILTNKNDSKQTITVKNYNENTHNLVYTNTNSALSKYLKVTSPTAAQQTAAQNVIWKKAGLAQA